MNIWWILVPLILIHVVMAFTAAPPNAVARRFLKKFELHKPINEGSATVTFGDKQLEDAISKEVISSYNNATFGYRYYKLPGYSGTPFVIHTQVGKRHVRIFIYTYKNRVDVFKEDKKNVVAYRLVSESLQNLSKSIDSTRVPV